MWKWFNVRTQTPTTWPHFSQVHKLGQHCQQRFKSTHLPLKFVHCAVQQPSLILYVVPHVLELLLLSTFFLESLLQLLVLTAQFCEIPLQQNTTLKLSNNSLIINPFTRSKHSLQSNFANGFTCTSSSRRVRALLARDISSSCSLISANDSSSWFFSLYWETLWYVRWHKWKCNSKSII